MGRVEIIDGFRGYFLVFMMLNHLVFTGGYFLVRINHKQLAFVEDAQGFIFLSGFLIGLIYCKKMQKTSFRDGARAIWMRAKDLYVYVLAVLLTILIAATLLPNAAFIWRNWIGDLSFSEPVRVVTAALMIYQPTYMDILPQYIIYMVFAPFAVWLTMRGQAKWVVLVCALLWMFVQLGLQRPLTAPIDEFLKGDGRIGIRNAFNVLAWQVVFFSALILGVLTAQNKIEWGRIFSPDNSFIPIAALAFCLFFLPLRIATAHGYMPQEMLQTFMPFERRSTFGLVYLLNFIAAAAGMTWLVIAGPQHRFAAVRAVANAIRWVMSLSFLRLLGRHSLQVYAWHVIIVYAVLYFDKQTPEFSELSKTAIALGAILLLAIPPLWRERHRWLTPQTSPKEAS